MDANPINLFNVATNAIQILIFIIGGIWLLLQIRVTNLEQRATLHELKEAFKDLQEEHKQIQKKQVEQSIRLSTLEEKHKNKT